MASRPLLEANTAEEALALAHAKYGPDAPVDVRPTRTGGVMGFFAAERYVADLTGPRAVDVSALLGPGTDEHTGDVSERVDTVPRDFDAGLDAAIAEASAALGSSDMSKTAPRPAPSVTTTGPAPSEPASPFAAALSRVTAEPVVTEAVMNVLDHTATAAYTGGLVSLGGFDGPGLDQSQSQSRAVLYSVPQVSRGADTSSVVTVSVEAAPVVEQPDALVSESVPAAVHINYAAALVASRSQHPYFPQAPATPAAVVEAATPFVVAQVETLAVRAAAPDTAPVESAPVESALVQTAPVQTAVATAMAAAIPHAPDPTRLLPRLDATGFPLHQIPDLFLHEVGEKGIHTALTRLIKMRTTPAPALPVAPCTVVFIGPGTEALTAAMGACGTLRADASQVAWVGPAHLSTLVPTARRISTPEGATAWLAAPKRATVVNVIAVHMPVSENIDPHTRAVIAALDPTMVLAVVDATRKAESVSRWVEAVDCVDAVALENASDTHDPATWLTLSVAPVALVEGRKATAARWASLLCERLTDMEA